MLTVDMDTDVERIACPACGARLAVMPRVKYLICTRCGSEYLVQRRGSAIGLEPFVPEQFEISRQIAEVEREQGEGCSNVFFWIFVVVGVFFCVGGYLSRTLFGTSLPLVIGWAISMLALSVGAVVMLRMLNARRAERVKLEARRQRLYEQQYRPGDAESTAQDSLRSAPGKARPDGTHSP